jgi:hypothetical protein
MYLATSLVGDKTGAYGPIAELRAVGKEDDITRWDTVLRRKTRKSWAHCSLEALRGAPIRALIISLFSCNNQGEDISGFICSDRGKRV